MTNYIFSGHDTIKLAKKYGTPLYVVSEDIIRKNVSTLIDAFKRNDIEYDINYAGKAFLNIAMCKIVKDLGISLDVVSGGELYTAYKAGFPMERVCMHGSNKSTLELEMAIDYKVGKVIVDSEYELFLLNELCKKKNHVMNISLRVSPGVEAHTHEFIQTGKIDSKFGIPIKQLTSLLEKSKDLNWVKIIGLHCHIGSQIFDVDPFLLTAEIMLDLIKEVKNLGFPISELNLGGGFGIPHLKGEKPFNAGKYIDELVDCIKKKCRDIDIEIPKIVIEPGRFVVGTAGITLYEVGIIKEIPGVRKYVSIDGGMTDNPRPALYGAEYDAIVANKFNEVDTELVTISGKCCETDTIISDINLPKIEPGDILAVLSTGAYNYSMSSNYNRLPKPAVVLLRGEKDELIVRRETYEDIIKNDLVPSWLEYK